MTSFTGQASRAWIWTCIVGLWVVAAIRVGYGRDSRTEQLALLLLGIAGVVCLMLTFLRPASAQMPLSMAYWSEGMPHELPSDRCPVGATAFTIRDGADVYTRLAQPAETVDAAAEDCIRAMRIDAQPIELIATIWRYAGAGTWERWATRPPHPAPGSGNPLWDSGPAFVQARKETSR